MMVQVLEQRGALSVWSRSNVWQLKLQWQAEVGQVVLHLHGEVDADAAHDLIGVAVVADVDGDLLVDLSKVTFIDLTGLRLLEDLGRRGTVRYRAPSLAVQRLLKAIGGRHSLPMA